MTPDGFEECAKCGKPLCAKCLQATFDPLAPREETDA